MLIMLLELSCSNFKSIKEQITFSMVASSDTSFEEELYQFQNYRISRLSSIYGANASGKTTLISAIGYMVFLVNQCTRFHDGDKIFRMPHKLALEKPTTYDVQFVVDGIRYAYGFSINDEEVLEEYLYHFPSGRQARIFERKQDKFEFGQKYQKELKGICAKTKSNKLFLSVSEAWSKLPEIINPFNFFRKTVVVHSNDSENWFEYSANKICSDKKMKNILVKFMQQIGVPIRDIEVKIQNLPLPQNEPILSLNDRINVIPQNIIGIEVKFVYEKYTLYLQEESQGTQKLFKLICPFMEVLTDGKVLFYDELENSLHPAIIDKLIDTFKSWKENSKPQLVFTTQDTTLLDLDIFRRDQIWFAERNPDTCVSEYYSLVEFKNVRKDDNVRKGYINGRYAPIPLKESSLLEILRGE